MIKNWIIIISPLFFRLARHAKSNNLSTHKELQNKIKQVQQNYAIFANESADDILKIKSTLANESNLGEVKAKKLEEMNKDGSIGFRLQKAITWIDSLRKNFPAKDEAERKRLKKGNSIIVNKETVLGKKERLATFGNTRYIATNSYGDCKVEAKKNQNTNWILFMICIAQTSSL